MSFTGGALTRRWRIALSLLAVVVSVALLTGASAASGASPRGVPRGGAVAAAGHGVAATGAKAATGPQGAAGSKAVTGPQGATAKQAKGKPTKGARIQGKHGTIVAAKGRPMKVLEPTYLFHGLRVPMGACAIMVRGKPEVLACNAPVLRAQARAAAQAAATTAGWHRREREAAPWAAGGAVLIIGFVLGRWTERRRANRRARKAAQQEAGGTWARKVFGVPQ